MQLVSRDIKTRYKRSVLGVGWTMINPLLTMIVLVVVFGQLFAVQTPNYPAYLLSGVLVWNFFSQTTNASMSQLLWSGSLLRRGYLPRAIFSIAAMGTGVVNLLLALVPLAAIMVATGVQFTPALLWVIIAVPLLTIFSLGLALLVSTLSMSFHDVIEMYSVLMTAWFFLTPVHYPLTIIPEAYRGIVVGNPMFYLLTLFRTPIQHGTGPEPAIIGISIVAAFASLIIGWIAFTSRADRIAYRF